MFRQFCIVLIRRALREVSWCLWY